ncbi:hypothetical protein [uncultured Rikenella sp.]|uniref:hypothetical protein n=1 Tax=uncultured Rikenella sp. TaxID=368003 RepID=UPI002610D2D8|nr:hypothetical protein [uncultured Rikenella sp.]
MVYCDSSFKSGKGRGSAAPGYRHSHSGVLFSVGNDGYSWVSTVSGVNSMDLAFNMAGLGTSGTTSRAFGLPLRCLSE